MPFEEPEYEWVQKPFAEQLEQLGYRYVDPKEIERERNGLRSVVLLPRLGEAIRRLNPWLPESHLDRVLMEVAHRLENPAQPDLVRCNEVVHEILVNGAKLQMDLGEGLKYYTIKLIDFENPEENEFLVTDSLPKRSSFEVQGKERKVAPDIVVFVNGIPLVVVEAKSPSIEGKDPMEEARLQLERYQEEAPQLFYSNLFVVATCGQQCEYAPVKGKFEKWRDEEIEKQLTEQLGRKPNPQEVFVASLFPKGNLLEFLRSFVAYADEPPKGRMKKIARHMQWRAVNRAIASARQARERGDGRGGTIWHWQGSGKTLTMLWLALKLRREFQNPCIIVLTDRRELDRQISKAFQHHGYPSPIQASSVKHLKELLQYPAGKTILVTIQKLGSKILSETEETEHLSEERNIFVLADEAHRSQYALLAARMRKILPRATFFAFTGTPLEKDDKNTREVFGDYVDRYTIKDALEDSVTVPITYQARMPELFLSGNADVDLELALIFEDSSEEDKPLLEELKRRRIQVTEAKVVQIKERMERVAKDIVDHFLSSMEPLGFKAMVVAHRRKMAVEYKRLIDEILKDRGRTDIQTEAIITVNQNESWAAPYRRSQEEEQHLINRFKDPNDPLKILLVSDKLLTGFDAPILAVMYFDKRLREHTLLQAIARVNRPCKLERNGREVTKETGWIIDYFGIAEELREALAKYENQDVERAYDTYEQWLERLEEIHRRASQFFSCFDLNKPLDFDTLERCLEELENPQKRKEFADLVREYGKLLNFVLPRREGLKFVDAYKCLSQIRRAAHRRFYDKRLRPKDYLPKLMEILSRAVGVGELDSTEPVEITSEFFLEELNEERTDKGKVMKTVSALRAHIDAHMDEDPVYYQSLREQLEQILKEFEQRRMEAHKVVEELLKLRERILERRAEAERLGLSERQLPFFNFFRSKGLELEEAKSLAEAIENVIKSNYIPDWTKIESARQRIKVAIYRYLNSYLKSKDNLSKELAKEWQVELFELAENHYREVQLDGTDC